LIDVILPLILTHEKEKELFLNEPNEFVNLALDIVD
jgi:hypothetical protein